LEIQHTVNAIVNTFPLTRKFGDLDILFQFRPVKKANLENEVLTDANELRLGISLVGLPPVEVIANKLRKCITLATDEGRARTFPKQMSDAILDSLLQLFPNFHQFLSDLFDMETFQLILRPKGTAGMFVEMDVDVNIEKLGLIYPAVANWLQHMQEVDISFLDFNLNTPPESDIDTAKAFLTLRLYYQNGWVGLNICLMLSMVSSEVGKLLWFDPKSQNVILKPGTNDPMEVEFHESSLQKCAKFRILMKQSIRLHELGCGSISLPILILQFQILSSKTKFPHLYEKDLIPNDITPCHRVELKMLYVGEKRLTTILIRPFFNLNVFRDLLVKDFHIQIDFIPNTTVGKHDFFTESLDDEKFEIIAGHWSMVFKFKMVLVPVGGILTSFLKMFTSTQLSSPDDLKFWWQIVSALQRDLKLLHGRVSRAEGVKPDFELTSDEQTTFRPKQKQKPNTGAKAKGRGFLRCTIC
jgi:hypothetical protein